MTFVERLDEFQRRHPRLALPIAVFFKYGDDQGGYLAALITYYGFLSLFPLLLLLSTILNFVLAGDPHLQHRILDSALGEFPIVGDQLSNGSHVSGSGIGLVVGVLGTLYGGLGVAQAAQNAMNTVWQVPRNERPNPIKQRLRSLLLLVVVGVSILGTTVLSALGTSAGAYGASVGVGIKVLLIAASFVLNVLIFTMAFRFATARQFVLRENLPGAITAAIAWQLLQWFGTAYVGHVVKNASVTNSVFALVLGLIAWIYLESVVVVISVEYNVVRAMHLYPRSLTAKVDANAPLTDADKRNYADLARTQRADQDERISVDFKPST
jgi:YihY family inner membrane protein